MTRNRSTDPARRWRLTEHQLVTMLLSIGPPPKAVDHTYLTKFMTARAQLGFPDSFTIGDWCTTYMYYRKAIEISAVFDKDAKDQLQEHISKGKVAAPFKLPPSSKE